MNVRLVESPTGTLIRSMIQRMGTGKVDFEWPFIWKNGDETIEKSAEARERPPRYLEKQRMAISSRSAKKTGSD